MPHPHVILPPFCCVGDGGIPVSLQSASRTYASAQKNATRTLIDDVVEDGVAVPPVVLVGRRGHIRTRRIAIVVGKLEGDLELVAGTIAPEIRARDGLPVLRHRGVHRAAVVSDVVESVVDVEAGVHRGRAGRGGKVDISCDGLVRRWGGAGQG